jgi:hypothetical protein
MSHHTPALALAALLICAAAPPAQLDNPRLPAQIQYLHDRLHITAAQEPHWTDFERVWLRNALTISPLRRDRFQTAQRGNALDTLNADEKLGEAQLDALKQFSAAFEVLFNSLSEQQKTIANVLFRQLRLE